MPAKAACPRRKVLGLVWVGGGRIWAHAVNLYRSRTAHRGRVGWWWVWCCCSRVALMARLWLARNGCSTLVLDLWAVPAQFFSANFFARLLLLLSGFFYGHWMVILGFLVMVIQAVSADHGSSCIYLFDLSWSVGSTIAPGRARRFGVVSRRVFYHCWRRRW